MLLGIEESVITEHKITLLFPDFQAKQAYALRHEHLPENAK